MASQADYDIDDSGVSDSVVRVEVVEFDQSSRQISRRDRTTELLRNRADDIKAAISEASMIAQSALDNVERRNGWRVSRLEATFGLTLAAETSIIVANASAEASFQVTLTIDRLS